MHSLIRTYDHDQDMQTVPNITIEGSIYVPFTATRVTPELAHQRRKVNMRRPGFWSPRACTPCLIVNYRRADSVKLSIVGRLP